MQDTDHTVSVDDAADTAESAFRGFAEPVVGEAVAHAQALAEHADPEHLHKLRVALRRFDTLLWAYKPSLGKQFYEEQHALCRYLARAAGDTRDWDVAIAVLGELGMAETGTRLRAIREETLARSRETIANANIKDMLRGEVTDANRELNTSPTRTALNTFALKRLMVARKLLRKRKKAAAGTKPHDYEPLHAARKAAKKLRYLTEFFEPALGAGRPHDVRKLKDLQERFGSLNDVVASRDLLLNTVALPITGAEIQAALKALKKEQLRRRVKVEQLL